MKISIDIL